MEQRAHSEGRELVLWLVGMPLAVVAASVVLLGLISTAVGVDHNMQDLLFSLVLVGAIGVPSALIARRMRKHRKASRTYFALAGAVVGFIGFAALALVLIWAEGGDDMFTVLANATWWGAARTAKLTATIAWPGAVAGLAGGIVFGVFARWADQNALTRAEA